MGKETDLERAIADLLNGFSMENESDTPDFILASYLRDCLRTFARAVRLREKWYGREHHCAMWEELRQCLEVELQVTSGCSEHAGLRLALGIMDEVVERSRTGQRAFDALEEE